MIPWDEWGELAPFAVLGLVGSLHCAGMCGGFAVAASMGTLSPSAPSVRARALLRACAYLIGKALTYAVLGLLVARAAGAAVHALVEGFGATPAQRLAAFDGLRRGLAWLTGAGVVAFGLSALGVPLLPRRLRALGAAGPLGRLFDAARSLSGTSRSFSIGLVSGLLPCGLSWAALSLAAGAPAHLAVLGMLSFGLATAPVLLAVGLGGAAIPAARRGRMLRWAAPAIVLLGVVTVARGGLAGPLKGAERVLPACCQEE